MYSRQFKNKEFASYEELTTYFKSNKECDVVNFVEYNEKWLAFYYEKVWYYQTSTVLTEQELNDLGEGWPFYD
jgi:hypothetical protein